MLLFLSRIVTSLLVMCMFVVSLFWPGGDVNFCLVGEGGCLKEVPKQHPAPADFVQMVEFWSWKTRE